MYDPVGSRCDDGTLYIVDLVTFLQIGGWEQLVLILVPALVFCQHAISQQQSNELEIPSETPKGTVRTCATRVASLMHCIEVPFTLIWCIIGFVIFAQMSADCRRSGVSKMILSWSIISLLAMLAYVVVICYRRLTRTSVSSSRVPACCPKILLRKASMDSRDEYIAEERMVCAFVAIVSALTMNIYSVQPILARPEPQ